MQNNTNNMLGIREFSMMIVLIIGAKLSDTTPVILFSEAKNGAWMLPIISALIMLPSVLTMISLLKKYKDKNLIDILSILLGKYIGFIYGIIISGIFFTYMVIFSRDITDTIITMFYPRTPPVAIYILFMASSIFICRRGLIALGGACFILVPILIIAASMAMFLTVPDMRLQYIYPIGGIKFVELIKGIPYFSALTMEVIIFSVLYPRVKSHKEFKGGSLIGLMLGTFLISIICITYLLVFDIVAVQHITFPFLELTRMIRIGRFISNAEAGFLAFWIIAAALRIAIYLYITTMLFLNTFHQKRLKPYFPLFAALCLFFGMLPENFSYILFTFRRYMLLSCFVFIVPLPYLLFFLSKTKRGQKQ